MADTDWQMNEADRRKEESDREREQLRKQMEETKRVIGKLGNQFGEIEDYEVAPRVMEKFNELGFAFDQVSRNIVISDSSGRFVMGIDVRLENGDMVMAVQVIYKPVPKDVDEHVSRMEVLRRRADIRHDSRKIRGAIAGAVMDKPVRNYAHKAGFYTIEQAGDTVKINVPEGFIPGEW